MGSVDEKPPRQALPKRARSFSESLRGLFRQQSHSATPIDSASTSRETTAPSSPVPEAPISGPKRNNSKSGKLSKLTTSKEAELSSSRGAPPSGGMHHQFLHSSPTGAAPKQHHMGLPHLSKLSLGHDPSSTAAAGSDYDAFSQDSPMNEEEDLSQIKRQPTPDIVPEVEEEGIPDNPPRTGSAASMDSAKHHRNIPPVGAADLSPSLSIDAALEREDTDSKHFSKHPNFIHPRNSSLKRPDSLRRSNNSSSSLSSTGVYGKGRNRADTVSVSSLSKYPEADCKCILQVENFKVYDNGMHEHNLKVTPLVSENSDKGLESLTRQKSNFSLTSIFKPKKEDNKLLEGAISLIPEDGYHSKYDSGSGDDEYDNESLPEEDMSDIKSKSKFEKHKGDRADNDNLKTPKIVNPMAAVGSEELKLINTLSEKIHRSFKNKSSKSHALVEGHLHRRIEPLEGDEKKIHGFFEKYGKPVGIIGHGAYGTVKVCARPNSPKNVQPLPTFSNGKRLFFGVKELKPKPTDRIEQFSTRITSEFIIGHSLGRCQKYSKGAPNILKILDLMECHDSFIEVMEFCPSGDLYNLLTRKSKTGTVLHPIEADCFMKQLLHGVQFMHMHGVAHCDLKPENILFYPNGLLKICDFGTSCVFQTAWERHVHFQSGTMGSEPYVAPEEFNRSKEYDPRLADCWSCGVVYCTMVLGHYLWKVAIRSKDMLFDSFCRQMAEEREFTVFEEMRHANPEINRLRKISLYYIFQVEPKKRITIDELLQTSWMRKTKCCVFYNRAKP